jgi:hypothetical protein
MITGVVNARHEATIRVQFRTQTGENKRSRRLLIQGLMGRRRCLPLLLPRLGFRGELVPTEAELARREGRSYEPASVLLTRIRAEREFLK